MSHTNRVGGHRLEAYRASTPAKSSWQRGLSPTEARDLEVALLEAKLPGVSPAGRTAIDGQIAALKRLNLNGGNMSKDKFKAALDAVTEGIAKREAELRLVNVEAAEGRITPLFAERERARLVAEIREADVKARGLLNDAVTEGLKARNALLAKTETERDPAARMADELERARLVASRVDGDSFVEQASAMLEAGQPARAAFLLEVAKDKGARYTTAIEADVTAALEASDPNRQAAKIVEDEIASSMATFDVKRFAVLSSSGLGIALDGSIGNGHPEEASRASAAAKMAAFDIARSTGTAYAEPEGVKPGLATGGDNRHAITSVPA